MVIETKYSVDDSAWVVVNNKPKKLTIRHVVAYAEKEEDYVKTKILYKVIGDTNGYHESHLYNSKEELIASL